MTREEFLTLIERVDTWHETGEWAWQYIEKFQIAEEALKQIDDLDCNYCSDIAKEAIEKINGGTNDKAISIEH